MSARPLRPARPAFLFFGPFSGSPEVHEATKRVLVERFGPLHPDGESPEFPFPETRTYRPTMGPGLWRKFYVMDALWPQDGLAGLKHETLRLEREIAGQFPGGPSRPVNIDPGLINDCRIILASTKDYSHRIYRGDGIWEEITLIYRQGAYESLPWTYPDFRNPDYQRFFARFRQELIARWKKLD